MKIFSSTYSSALVISELLVLLVVLCNGFVIKIARKESTFSTLHAQVVITGVGTVTPIGVGATDTFAAICEGKSGIKRLPSWADEFPCKVAGLVEFDPAANGVKAKNVKRNARYTHFALWCAEQAIKDALIDPQKIDLNRFGCIIGSALGGVEWFEKSCNDFTKAGGGYAGLRAINPFTIPALISNTAAGMVAIEHKAKGPNYAVVSAGATGAHSIGAAFKHLQDGEADIMIAGGSEAQISPLCLGSMSEINLLATDEYNDEPHRASRPFDAHRCGSVLAEGCGLVVLETEEHARARGARIYCELKGVAIATDADPFDLSELLPSGDGLRRCMELVLERSGVSREEVGLISAHGASKYADDRIEAAAINKVFGSHKVKVTAFKSVLGQTLGAAGGIDAVICAKIFQQGVIPPTANYETPDPDCKLNIVAGKALRERPKFILSNHFGYGGMNAALLYQQYES